MQTEALSSIPLPTEEPSSIDSAKYDQPTALERSKISSCRETLTAEPTINDQLSTLNQTSNHQLSTINHQLTPTVIDTKPLPVAVQGHKSRRKGRVASLPKLQRDMVNHMIWNGVPYKNIVAALDELDFTITERNISNWATGGYLEWRFEQDLVLQNRLDQDHLVDNLRREDASELPEVGLQAAATRISQILVQKTACAADVEANIGTFSEMVDVLCRLNREIAIMQKQRDDSRRTLGPGYAAARVKNEDQLAAIEFERFYSNPPADSTLAKPSEAPFLPPEPTSYHLAQADQEAEDFKKLAREKQFLATLQAISGKKAPTASSAPKPLSSPKAAN